MPETFERALRVVAEGVPRALAVFGADGGLKIANERWLALLSGRQAPERAGISEHLAALGLQPVSGRPGVFHRGDQEYRVERTQTGHSVVVSLEPLVPTEQRDQLRERFLSITSHDIRGSVANVRSYGSLLAARTDLDAKTKRAVDTIVRNADRALAMLRSYFDSERAQLAPPPVELEPQSLLPLLEAEVERIRPHVTEKGVRFHVQFQPNLPDVRVDAERFSHIVGAYLLHGLNRAPPGGRLELDVASENGRLCVRVRDSGPALSAAEQEHLYDRDRRVVEEGKLSGGFELSLAREEVRAHGGEVAHSVSPAGTTTLEFAIPL